MYEKYKYHFLAVVQDVNRLIQKIDVTTVDQTELLRWKTLFVDRGEKSIVDQFTQLMQMLDSVIEQFSDACRYLDQINARIQRI